MPLEADQTSCPVTTIPLRSSVVYGPVDSRRFGRSLGLNLMPANQKICSFDCVYCQYGEARQEGLHFPPGPELLREIEDQFEFLQSNQKRVDWIMFSGNGEPTLHPEFLPITEAVIALRDKFLPRVPLGVLSNSATCFVPGVQTALMKLDGRFMKLDAGTLRMFYAVNRPASTLMWADVVSGLYHLPKITLQSLFVTGQTDNTGEEAIADWIRAVAYVCPLSVQIYTIERPPQDAGVRAVPHEKLESIAGRLTGATRIPAAVY